jgi:ferredoxin/flavodoxin---NADP+ reductase
MANYIESRVTNVHHWSDKLFSFMTSRDPSLRFENGQFIMVGLEVDGRRVARAYSIASANYEDELEFYSIKVSNGLLTSRLQRIREGDAVWLSTKPTGTLLIRDLLPGRRLFLLCTGTGIAPFASVMRDPETYQRFEQIVLVRCACWVRDLAYGNALVEQLREDEFLGDNACARLMDYSTVTREPFIRQGRITTLIETEQLFHDLNISPLDATHDRVMLCGGASMLKDLRTLLEHRGFRMSPGVGEAGDFVVERAFVET